MCCFSGKVKRVSDTSIFCRMGPNGNQVVIYSMALDTEKDVAMILPIPIQEERDDSSVKFIDLSKAPDLFEKLDRAFPVPQSLDLKLSFGRTSAAVGSIKVHSVGSFDASFVPRIADFDRLDPQFRIEPAIWEKLPQYRQHGFVVFKLKAGNQKVHPMAFAYPAGNKEEIVFPTVHIHDGEVHKKAEFDHALYCQTDSRKVKLTWQESIAPAGGYVDPAATHGTFLADEHVYKRSIRKERKNEDIAVPS